MQQQEPRAGVGTHTHTHTHTHTRHTLRSHDGSEDTNSDGAHGGSGAENQPVDREEGRRGYGGGRGGGGKPDKKQRNTLHNRISHTRVSPQIVPTEHKNRTQKTNYTRVFFNTRPIQRTQTLNANRKSQTTRSMQTSRFVS